MTAAPPAALRGLLAGLIDYAGLFPPAALTLPAAVRRFAAYREGPAAWMLGRLVVPARQLDELAALRPWTNDEVGSPPWAIAALGGPDPADDFARVGSFNDAFGADGGARVDVFEAKVTTPDDVRRLAASCEPGIRLACEVPRAAGIAALLDAIADVGAVAKLRAGGVTPDAFPEPRDVANFLWEAVRRQLPIKATAGLHHAIRGEYSVTYEPDAARATMHGFLNLLCGAAWALEAKDGAISTTHPEDVERSATLVALLEQRDAAALRVSAAGLTWAETFLDVTTLSRVRSEAVVGIGSCSFEEPVAELQQLGLL